MDIIFGDKPCVIVHVSGHVSLPQVPVLHDLTHPFPSLSSPSSSATSTPKTGHLDYTTRPENLTMTSVRCRKNANGASEPTSSSIDPTPSTSSSALSGLLTATSSTAEREEVKVNNASVTEMKHACDDALKRVSTPAVTCPPQPFLLSYRKDSGSVISFRWNNPFLTPALPALE